MKQYNLILLYDKDLNNILFCIRRKEPYKDLYNLVGGKINPGEDHLEAAYRELFEETSVSKNDTVLSHLMDIIWYTPYEVSIEVYIGKLNKELKVKGDENILVWLNKNNYKFYETLFAGDGNLYHTIQMGNMIIDKLI